MKSTYTSLEQYEEALQNPYTGDSHDMKATEARLTKPNTSKTEPNLKVI